MNPIYNADIDSPNEMLVDSDDLVVDAENEKDDGVHDIHPDEENYPRADDKKAIRDEVFKSQNAEQLEILEDVEDTWEIKGWKDLPRRVRGPIFWAAGHPWRVLMFPKGNNVDFVSFYLEHGYGEDAGKEMPENFAVCIQFGLVLWNPDAPWVLQHHSACHRFTKEEGDWGFTRFVELRKLWTTPWEKTGHYLADGEKAKMTAIVRHVKDETGVLWHNFINYDSKAETGYVGLKNQGATCYLNSLLQSLYFTNAFRKAVYQIPTQNEDTLQNSAYTLQRLFYQLQTANTAVSTMELTKSFGWETRHIFEQQDVQELSRKLMERMEEKMKGTEAENVLQKLFSGKVRTYIDCINVAYESRRVEDFWDVQLNVSGNKNVQESFEDYIAVEIMNGENQYMAGDTFKLQDAKKGVIFESFPEVLHLQLKRFQYDIERDAMMKINDRYEFPETFDAAPYLADNADKSEPWIYQLHGVLVHSGDLNAGHYYAFIKPNKDGWFYKYDDDKVTKAAMREVLEDNYGGEDPRANGNPALRKGKPALRQNSAYMLVYIRQTRVDDVLLPVTTEDTPPHLQKKLEEEAAEREARRKAKEDQHLYAEVRVITDQTFRNYEGTDLTTFDSKHEGIDPGAAKWYKFLRRAPLSELLTSIAQDAGDGVDPRRVRLWGLVNRQNKTTRPDCPFTDTNMTIEEAYHKLIGKMGDMRVWAEIAEEVDEEGNPIWPNNPSQVINGQLIAPQILLFLKYFDVAGQCLYGVGHVYINREKKVEDLVSLITKKMGWPEKGTQLKLYEEIKPSMIEPMKGKQTLKAAELQDGDIICFQTAQGDVKSELDSSSMKSGILSTRSNSIKSEKSDTSMKSDSTKSSSGAKGSNIIVSSSDHIEDARQYYDFLMHRREVKFWPHPTRGLSNNEQEEGFTLVLSLKHTYDQMAARVAEALKVNPTHIRFWTINGSSGNPKAAQKRAQQTVYQILNPPYSTFSNNNQRGDALYFEILDMSLTELDTKKAVKVTWVSEGISKEETHDILVPKNGDMNDVILALIKKAKLDDEETGGPIRAYEIHANKLYKNLSREYSVVAITDYVTVIAERVPEEDLPYYDDMSNFVHAYHFQSEPSKTHGIPFLFRMIEDEKFSDTKKRLEKRTGFKGKNFEKIKFALVRRGSFSKPLYLTDDSVLSQEWKEDDLLGLDHTDRSRGMRNGAVDLFLK